MSLNIVDNAGAMGAGASPTMQKQRLFEAFAEANPGAIKAMESKKSDLLFFINRFGFKRKYGVNGKQIDGITYFAQLE